MSRRGTLALVLLFLAGPWTSPSRGPRRSCIAAANAATPWSSCSAPLAGAEEDLCGLALAAEGLVRVDGSEDWGGGEGGPQLLQLRARAASAQSSVPVSGEDGAPVAWPPAGWREEVEKAELLAQEEVEKARLQHEKARLLVEAARLHREEEEEKFEEAQQVIIQHEAKRQAQQRWGPEPVAPAPPMPVAPAPPKPAVLARRASLVMLLRRSAAGIGSGHPRRALIWAGAACAASLALVLVLGCCFSRGTEDLEDIDGEDIDHIDDTAEERALEALTAENARAQRGWWRSCCCCSWTVCVGLFGALVVSVIVGAVLWRDGLLQPIFSEIAAYAYIVALVAFVVILLLWELWRVIKQLVHYVILEFRKLKAVWKSVGRRAKEEWGEMKYRFHDFMDDGHLNGSYVDPKNTPRRKQRRPEEARRTSARARLEARMQGGSRSTATSWARSWAHILS